MFVISSAALVPQQPVKAASIEVLTIGVLFWVLQLSGNIRYLRRRAGHPWSWFWPRAVMSQLATIPFCVAGILLLLDTCGAIYWLAPIFILVRGGHDECVGSTGGDQAVRCVSAADEPSAIRISPFTRSRTVMACALNCSAAAALSSALAAVV